MSVYFIQLGKYLKVGYSENAERRYRKLFSSATNRAAPWDCPRRLMERTLLGYVPGRLNEERRAHESLAMFGVGCEFFLCEPPVMEYVAECLAANHVNDRVVLREAGQAPVADQSEPPVHGWDTAALDAALDRMFAPAFATRPQRRRAS
jgi:hypothetical protein